MEARLDHFQGFQLSFLNVFDFIYLTKIILITPAEMIEFTLSWSPLLITSTRETSFGKLSHPNFTSSSHSYPSPCSSSEFLTFLMLANDHDKYRRRKSRALFMLLLSANI